jgi:predicted nucleic acid-binding protein
MSRGFLLDTNVPSELARPQPDPRVAQWLEATDDDSMYLSVITIGEAAKASPSIRSRTVALVCAGG